MGAMIDIPGDLEPWRRNARMTLWNELRAKRLGGARWRRWTSSAAAPADFFCLNPKIAVILDDGGEHDAKRVAYAKARGWRVLRAHPTEVAAASGRICDALRRACGVCDGRYGFEDSDIEFDRDVHAVRLVQHPALAI
jgi:very-short-patch-repair endonuclease